MKKLTLKGYRAVSTAIMVVIVIIIGAIASISQKSVLIVGSKAYAPIYNGDRTKPCVALMFNVYEGSNVVLSILDVLDKYNAKSTFFVGGCWADDNNFVLEQIVLRGHELANHGYFHKDHSKLSLADNAQEIETTHKLLFAITGKTANLFAPPSGAFSTQTLTSAEKLGYRTIMWSKDTIDWRDKSADLVFARATKNVQNGDFVLMHPKKHTLDALDKILKFYLERGISAVTVTECINDNHDL